MTAVLITGGGSGVGADMARAFAAAGHDVVICGRRPALLAAVASGASVAGRGRIRAIAGDVADPEQLRAVFAAAGPCRVVIANAGTAEAAPFGRIDPGHWQRVIATNLTGTFLTFQQGLAQMRGPGRLIAIASVAGLRGAAYAAAYAASKHGVIGLVRSLALEVANKGITVNAICPGYIDSEMTRDSVTRIAERTGRSEAEALAALVAQNPQGRLLQPAEVTAVAMWLASDAAAAVNGQAITLDGRESA